MSIPLAEIVATWAAVRGERGRLAKRAHLATLFRRLDPADLRLAASYLAGAIPQGALHVGWRLVHEAEQHTAEPLPLFAAAAAAGSGPPPTLVEVDACFAALAAAAGSGAAARRRGLLAALFARARPVDRDFLRALLGGELRQGALRALVTEALADALGVDAEKLRRAAMFAGDFAAVVEAAARAGEPALAAIRPRPLVPIEPMLAQQAASPEEAFTVLGPAAVEWKLDGVRVQIHRSGGELRAYTRALRDVTAFVPEVLERARGYSPASFILDGELTAVGPQGRPLPFQDLMSRFTGEAGERPPLAAVYFDVLFLDGESWVDRPYRQRRAALEAALPAADLVPASVAASAAEIDGAFSRAIDLGHEGVMLKALDSPYLSGRRGAHWLKLKPAVTLDLVVLAAEWGHGRRQGWLSNLHLGARLADEPGRFAMLGKTFKGLTDAMLEEMTTDLLGLATRREGHVVHVRPERVVEIAFDSLQRSPRYDSGLALRFARVKRFRPDKEASQASTLDEVRALHARMGASSG